MEAIAEREHGVQKTKAGGGCTTLPPGTVQNYAVIVIDSRGEGAASASGQTLKAILVRQANARGQRSVCEPPDGFKKLTEVMGSWFEGYGIRIGVRFPNDPARTASEWQVSTSCHVLDFEWWNLTKPNKEQNFSENKLRLPYSKLEHDKKTATG